MRYVLGIESSCDETAAAVVENGCSVLSNIVSSQIEIHKNYGGVVPEIASRKHLEDICGVVDLALETAGLNFEEIDAIAVTYGPGLIGSLLVGVSYAKAAAFALKKPLIGVHHIEGHIYSVIFEHSHWDYPAIAFIVSGGHTNLFWIPKEGVYHRLGYTRDDAAGEAYDKVAKLLGLEYPGGPILDRLAQSGDRKKAPLVFRSPNIPDAPYDFSFSGLKTAVLRYINENNISPVSNDKEIPSCINDLAASFQYAVVTTLIKTLLRAVKDYSPNSIILAGGVACNSDLRKEVDKVSKSIKIPIYYPNPKYTTDNAAMIAAAGYARLQRGEFSDLSLSASPTLKLHSDDDDVRKDFRSGHFRN